MVTSKSSEAGVGFAAGVSVFSGRPDPTWPVTARDAARLVGLWESLAPSDSAAPAVQPLGYRGCFLRGGGREWRAYRGVVTLGGARGGQRRDDGRAFERLLLSTAPSDAVPWPFVDAELRP